MTAIEDQHAVLTYLGHILEAAQKLTISDDSPGADDGDVAMSSRSDDGSRSPAVLIDSIAHCLLQACEPRCLISSTSHLPELRLFGEKEAAAPGEEDEEEETPDDEVMEDSSVMATRKPSGSYCYRRTDYLRLLLRAIAPVSMEVAAVIVSLLMSSTPGVVERSVQLQAFFLFSQWLQAAPHLAELVTDLFCLKFSESPQQLMSHEYLGTSTCTAQSSFVFLLCEACCNVALFYAKRKDMSRMRSFWDWQFLFDLVRNTDIDMTNDDSVEQYMPQAAQWYSVHAISAMFQWSPSVTSKLLGKLDFKKRNVPWKPHPWAFDQEELLQEETALTGAVSLWGVHDFAIVSAELIQSAAPTSSPYLARIGHGVSFYRQGSLSEGSSVGLAQGTNSSRCLVQTPTTCQNLSLLGAAMCQEPSSPPILICGAHDSGKSSLVREMLRMCRPRDELLEVHMDEETDSKTLIGSYTTTDIPGEFSWRPGALTRATREGKWVLMEDVDAIPVEIQATLVNLLEKRLLPLGNGQYEPCHPGFRLFGTCTTSPPYRGVNQGGPSPSMRIGVHRGNGKTILNPTLWRKVHIEPIPTAELKQIASSLHPSIPETIRTSAFRVFNELRNESVDDDPHAPGNSSSMDSSLLLSLTRGRRASVRDLLKLLSRLANGQIFEKGASYATESQRLLCLADTIDVFLGSSPEHGLKTEFLKQVAAPIWGVPCDLALASEVRRPSVVRTRDSLQMGRAVLALQSRSEFAETPTGSFAQTNHALRLMEAVAVCVRENEPVLLVGETGCGKTTLLQQLALQAGREIVVQNLSIQTDSSDLLGGYRPLELRNVAMTVYHDFLDLFVGTFSRKRNTQFIQYASSMLEKRNWKNLSQCFQRAANLGTKKVAENQASNPAAPRGSSHVEDWANFSKTAAKFEQQRRSCDTGLAFSFMEGALVNAIRKGHWVLLDEINLASADTLQRLCGLLDDPNGSVTLTERGDGSALKRHPHFRLFAAMNPATDTGKKELPFSIRARFSELYVSELCDPVELRLVAARYLDGVLPLDGKPAEHQDVVIKVVEVYIQCRKLANSVLSDGAGNRPRYTMRSLSRALAAARTLVLGQKMPLSRAIFEGFQLAFEGSLDALSARKLRKVLQSILKGDSQSNLEHPGRMPGKQFVLLKPFWVKAGLRQPTDWSTGSVEGKSRFILTPTVSMNLRRIACAVAAGPWPVLLEGPTSAGKTTLVEYIAARCGHDVVRINNHEHTDVQEYTGSFVADQSGRLKFQDGLLVRALRRGHWVILDELNLAPSEVLEALNRLLDDNRELYLSETNETVIPHSNFRLFATQNPSGLYGGRKPLSKAFRNRFVEMHVGDIPSDEMVMILEKRCGCPPTHAKKLVNIMEALRFQRSKNAMFLGKDSLITPRDLLRWAQRGASSKIDLAHQGYLLLAERLRSTEDKQLVKEVIEENLHVKLDIHELYYGENSVSRKVLGELSANNIDSDRDGFLASLAPTQSLLRLIVLVMKSIQQKEPVLLVGDTGCGKTTVVQLLSYVLGKRLSSVNCHATTETADLIGGLRPVRGRGSLQKRMHDRLQFLHEYCESNDLLSADDGQERELQCESQPLATGTKSKDVLTLPSVGAMMTTATEIQSQAHLNVEKKRSEVTEASLPKRRKIDEDDSSPAGASSLHASPTDEQDTVCLNTVMAIVSELESLQRRYDSLFEWSDGPLISAMKAGEIFLLDEMSLADDAVLERLNSVLEPSRTMVLAEKGGLDSDQQEDRVVAAEEGFCIFATMNPGGDFGKRELSPALRSRFTEIWVPPIQKKCDFELVLSRALCSTEESLLHTQKPLLGCMLDYVKWFNESVCSSTTGSSPFSSYTLSLRDILSWGQFVNASQTTDVRIGVWDAFYHGARLMHLDGFGLGAGLSVDDVAIVRDMADKFLLDRIPAGAAVTNRAEVEAKFQTLEGRKFGAAPFFVAAGILKPELGSFDMGAPTTAGNAFRVMRALQLRKPVLLEGSPGVGKTSLITALAAASGHKLVRINLSEQTDISDLMGSDLPAKEQGSTGMSFSWCDGVLLTAIKEGSWVLLDELNLAPQSVLEGLNSCLDHRAEVFIPELGLSFKCPSSFRVFAAQNPLAQGGGRKGLPRSFLNRFTKVYVDTLGVEDLGSIVASRYQSLDKCQVKRMIEFNKKINDDVTMKRSYGTSGSPWEFNLRDIFRWSDLTGSNHVHEENAYDLYLQRFRTPEDRTQVQVAFHQIFGLSLASTAAPTVTVAEDYVVVGGVRLPKGSNAEHDRGATVSPCLTAANLFALRAIAKCVSSSWPCLLVGPSGSGKTLAVEQLSHLCHSTLIHLSLTPSSDVAELIGSFEQASALETDVHAVRSLHDMVTAYIADHCLSGNENTNVVLRHEQTLMAALEDWEREGHSCCATGSQLNDAILELSSILKKASFSVPLELGNRTESSDSGMGQFIWKDGVLVEAMLQGHWLILDNVNLCPSSVLDRLNCVMEEGGELLLLEGGTVVDDVDGSSAYRVITPHPSFRIFLTMNERNGEVSRAMRNRCVEIFLLPHELVDERQTRKAMTHPATVDYLDFTRQGGVRSLFLASKLLEAYRKELEHATEQRCEPPSLHTSTNMAAMLIGNMTRGISIECCLRNYGQIGYELKPHDAGALLYHDASSVSNSVKIAIPSNRNTCSCLDATVVHTEWDSRVLRSFASFDAETVTEPLGSSPFALKTVTDEFYSRTSLDKVVVSKRRTVHAQVTSQLVQRFLNYPRSSCDTESRCVYFEGFVGTFSAEADEMIDIVLDIQTDTQLECNQLKLKRLSQLAKEQLWAKTLAAKSSLPASLSILAASFLMSESLLEQSEISCPITPLVYRFFEALDHMVDSLMKSLSIERYPPFWDRIEKVMRERDSFWSLLARNETKSETLSSCQGTKFVVHWNWLKKALSGLLGYLATESSIEVNFLLEFRKVWNRIDGLLGNDRCPWIKPIRKRLMQPVVPQTAASAKAILQCRFASRRTGIIKDYGSSAFLRSPAPLSLEELVNVGHPILCLSPAEKNEILCGITTLYWAFTDEHGISRPLSSSSLPLLGDKLNQRLSEKKLDFVSALSQVIGSTHIDDDQQREIDNTVLDSLERDMADASSLNAQVDFLSSMLRSYARIQQSMFWEYVLVRRELSVVGQVCRVMMSSEGSDDLVWERLTSVAPGLRQLVNDALTHSSWEVHDLRPYQTLIWVLEGQHTSVSVQTLVRSLVPAMLASYSKHTTTNSFCDAAAGVPTLDLPDMWQCDEPEDENKTKHSTIDQPPPSLGLTSLAKQSRSSSLFDWFGCQFSMDEKYKFKYVTMENHSSRLMQAQDLIKSLSAPHFALGNEKDEYIVTARFLLVDILSSSALYFGSSNLTEELLAMARGVSPVDEAIFESEVFEGNAYVEQHGRDVILPLLECLHAAQESQSAKAWVPISEALVYLGILRLGLLLPDSPVDPGQVPKAKTALLQDKLINLWSKLKAQELMEGFDSGSFQADVGLEQASCLTEKRLKQQKKAIERPEAPSFRALYEETQRFGKLSSKSTLLSLMEKLQNERRSDLDLQRIVNWQRTASSFCTRLGADFEAYDEIISPLVQSIRMIQDGLQHMAEPKATKEEDVISRMMTTLCEFPIQDLSATAHNLDKMLSSCSLLTDGEVISVAIAVLVALYVNRLTVGSSDDDCRLFAKYISRLSAIHFQGSQLFKEPGHSVGKDDEETRYREQFPDHREEFTSLIVEDTSDDVSIRARNPLDEDASVLSNTHLKIVSKVFDGFYSKEVEPVDDAKRKLVFHSSYNAAYTLGKSARNINHTKNGSERMSMHTFAVSSMFTPFQNSASVIDHLSGSHSPRNMQTEPFPAEAIIASKPLMRLALRARLLLNTFQGHAVLIGIGKVCSKVQRLDLRRTPLGKVLTGLEVVLRQAQAWEEHASERVRLGEPLKAISQVVARWRKIELESWSDLLDFRKERHLRQAQRSLLQLLTALGHDDDRTVQLSSSASLAQRLMVPSWVWRGTDVKRATMSQELPLVRLEEHFAFVKTIDTYVLTAPLGEFTERLRHLRSCAQYSSDVAPGLKFQQSRALQDLCDYYEEFLPTIDAKITALRKPIEDKLKAEVKLAKWDEQSYYSLAASTENNHRRLMKILAMFDECLLLNSGQVVQEDLIRGVRSDVCATEEELCCSIPVHHVLFPLDHKETEEKPRVAQHSLSEVVWVSKDASLEGHASMMKKYSLKMDELAKNGKLLKHSYALVGQKVAYTFSESIFARIDALRSKSSRPLKARALVDLFKELKRNGLQSTKWCVPQELRQLQHVFLLPKPVSHEFSPLLEKAETYFLRCSAELGVFRSEVSILGSKHMTLQDTGSMLNLCDSGFFVLTQQRCLIASALSQIATIESVCAELSFGDKELPKPQSSLRSQLASCDLKTRRCTESLQQLLFHLKSTECMLSGEPALSWLRSSLDRLENLLEELKALPMTNPTRITKECDLAPLEDRAAILDRAIISVSQIRQDCAQLECLPLACFDESIEALRDAVLVSRTCLLRNHTTMKNTVKDEKHSKNLIASIASAVESVLLAFQACCEEAQEDEDVPLLKCHKALCHAWSAVNLNKINARAAEVISLLIEAHDENHNFTKEECSNLTQLASNFGALLHRVKNVTSQFCRQSIRFYCQSAKLVYVVMRVFRVLTSKGYCSDGENETDADDSAKDFSNATFQDDQEGTGMGEGDGKEDVTDQLENEDQLSGLKGDTQNENEHDQTPKQLDEEEAEQGMEMEQDFEGDMFDVPEPEEEDPNNKDEDEEELDRQLGDDSGDGEIVDEKMWNNESDNEQDEESDEKFEQENQVSGEAIDGAMHTKDDDTEQESKAPEENSGDGNKDETTNGDDNDYKDDFDKINEGSDEEEAGTEVRGGVEDGDDNESVTDEPMDLDTNEISLDAGEDQEDQNDDESTSQAYESDTDSKADEGETPSEDDQRTEDATAEDTPMAEFNSSTTGEGTQTEEPEQHPENEEESVADNDENPEEAANHDPTQSNNYGVHSNSGKDNIVDNDEDKDEENENNGQENGDMQGMSNSSNQEDDGAAPGSAPEAGDIETGDTGDALDNAADIPNPFKNPGDASDFWHKKLDVVESPADATEEDPALNDENAEDGNEEKKSYQYTADNAPNSEQVLGAATEDETQEIDDSKSKEADPNDEVDKTKEEKLPSRSSRGKTKKPDLTEDNVQNEKSTNTDDQSDQSDDVSQASSIIEEQGDDDATMELNDDPVNRVFSDASVLKAQESNKETGSPSAILLDESQISGISSAEVSDAQAKWHKIQGDTNHLSRRLCEKLRLVMEPLVASKLRGDYRTGKRINMKRVIGYIASGYRKDKIWLRRTKPAKRDYRVLLAVDDSESMAKSGAGEMALRAMATLAVGMNQLEIGELGVASFGEDMKLLHPFHLPFTSQCGTEVVMNFQFNQKRTRTALCVQSTIDALDAMGDPSSRQLVFMISDGRIERDSREDLKRLIREMAERNILLVMIIVEGSHNKKDSIMNMKEVTFKNGKPQVNRFIEDYPFPYYIILEDMTTLPEVLGDALRQWFEILTQLRT